MKRKFKIPSLRGIFFWLLIFVIFSSSIYIITYFKEKINKAMEFRDKLISLEFEGYQSEKLGFLSILTAEISTNFKPENANERDIDERIKHYLLELQLKIDNIKPSLDKVKLKEDSNIENENPKSLEAWFNPEIINKVQYKQLNLTQKVMEEFPSRPFLQTSISNFGFIQSSYVLVPTYLIDYENGRINLSNTIKREIIYSKVIELDLLQILEKFKDDGISQAYFIPISGLVRLANREDNEEKKDPLNYYNEMFRGLTCFSDQVYFHETLKKENEVRKSNLYLDPGGFGFIYTYSIAIKNRNLDIIGMIGLDRKVKDLDELMNKLIFGYGDFEYKSFDMDKVGHLNLLTNDEIYLRKILGDKKGSEIINQIKKPDKLKELLKGELIAQIPRTNAYLLHTAPKKLAFFYFDPNILSQKYRLFQGLYIFSLVCIVILIILIVRFNWSGFIAKKVHVEVVNNLNGGLVIIDGNGIIRFHNRKMAELIEDLNLEGKNLLSNFMDRNSKSEYIDFIQKLIKGFEFTGRIRRTNGTEFPAIISCAAVDYPGVDNAQMLIIIPSETLERTIAARFIHSFSHALKTPATSILLLADRLRRKKTEKNFDYYYSLLKQQVDEFTVMVTNLLGFSKLEMEEIRPHKEQGNIAALLKGVVKPFKEKAFRSQVELIENIPERLIVDFDRNMMRIILNNLMENALKYTSAGKIIVDAYEMLDEVMISFTDTGIGVPEDEKDKIFEKFFRGKSEEVRTKDGIGIGLYLSKLYANLHNGSLSYKPVKDENKNKMTGSCFILKIPK